MQLIAEAGTHRERLLHVYRGARPLRVVNRARRHNGLAAKRDGHANGNFGAGAAAAHEPRD
jgi:hypothetical protein